MTDLEVTAPDARLAWETPELIDLSVMLDDVQNGTGPNSDGTTQDSAVVAS